MLASRPMLLRRTRALLLASAMSALWLLPFAAARADGYAAEISAIDNLFTPDIVRIQPGDTVEWRNDGRSPHDVTADDGGWVSGNLDPGAEFDRTFDAPGVYAFYCSYHGSPGVGMTGTVLVGDVPLPGPAGGVGPGREPVPGGFARTIRVPQQAPTIQAGVDRARPGGMVLVSPGVYEESVTVTTPYLTIRGTDRNEVILDGGFERANGIHVVEADGVTVQNMTARQYQLNGFYWSGVHGYWAHYVTAYNNGDYGIYAYDSDWGQFDHVYASGSRDSGLYIGQCFPCHAVIADALAEHNAMGYSGTNAGGDLAIVNSEWRDNMAGIVPNTLDSEALAPQRDVTVAGNYVHDNNSTTADTKDLEYPTFGNGIILAGGQDNRVVENLVENHQGYGIAVMPNLDAHLWIASGNEVRDNIVRNSGRADLVLGAPAGGGNCFSGNTISSSLPPAIQLLRGCNAFTASLGGGDLAPTVNLGTRVLDGLDGEFPHGDWKEQPAPPDQPQMTRPASAPPQPAVPDQAVPQPYVIRLASEIRSQPGPTVRRQLTVFGIPLATSWWSLLIGLYGYVLPGFLYASWVTIALWDLIRQESEPVSFRARWMLGVILIPFLGPILYFAFGKSPIPRQLRLLLVVGGAAACLLFAVVAAVLGG
jgi:plastocyanin